jgi:hypothetical protein
VALIPHTVRNASIVTVRLIAALALASTASAQNGAWTVTRLNPPGAAWSQALAASGGQQVGRAYMDGAMHAALWNGTAASFVDLNPAGATSSEAFGANDGQQVGDVVLAGSPHASLWSGTANSWIDLSPVGSPYSVAFSISAGQQAGYAMVGGVQRASLWSGTAASWVDLHPAGASQSIAHATSGGQQAGYANVGGVQHASLWNGTAASWVDLHPQGLADSRAHATNGGQQVGVAGGRASLWSGTAASWVSLQPAGATQSFASSIDNGYQAGDSEIGGRHRAGLWRGSAGSWIDLDAFLPPGFSGSYAYGISTVGAVLNVTGFGYVGFQGNLEALLWTLCRTPEITSQPVAQSACPRGSVQYAVVANAFEPATYQWQVQTGADPAWNPIVPGINSFAGVPQFEATGTATSRVSLRPAIGPGGARQWPHPGYQVRAIITNTCGSTTTDAAPLTICTADFNCDGSVDFFDYDDFVLCFEDAACPAGDFNRDGDVDFFDYDDFVLAFEAPC